MLGDEGCLFVVGSLPPQQVAKSFEAKLDSPMAGRVTAGDQWRSDGRCYLSGQLRGHVARPWAGSGSGSG